MGMRYLIVVVMAAMAGCAMQPRFGGTVTDAPDTSHTNSGSAAFGKDGRLHIKPAHVVDTMTPEQHAAARAGAIAYFKKLNERRQAWLDAMTPEQRHAEICSEVQTGIEMQLEYPGDTGVSVLQYYLEESRMNDC